MSPRTHRFRIEQKVQEYEVFEDEDTQSALFEAIRDEEEYRSFRQSAIRSAFENRLVTDTDGLERFESLLKPFLGRYRRLFDDDELFDEFRQEFLLREKDMAREAINKIDQISDGENPEEVLGPMSVATLRAKGAI